MKCFIIASSPKADNKDMEAKNQLLKVLKQHSLNFSGFQTTPVVDSNNAV